MTPEMTVTIPDVAPEATPASPQVTPTVTPEATPASPQVVDTPATTDTTPSPDTDVQNIVSEQAKAVTEARTLLDTKGIEYDALVDEYMEKGSLSDETYKALEGAGITRSLADGYIQGINAANTLFINQVKQSAGGDKEYEVVTSFVASKGKNAIDAFNNIIETGDLNAITDYLGGIKAQMQLKHGTANPSLIGSDAQVATGFSSTAELTKAMSDPRYAKDAQYRAEVTAKLAKSNIISFKKY